MLREALKSMGKAHLIGNGVKHLVPPERRGELKGKDQRDYAKRSVNKAYAKGRGGKNSNKNKAQQGLTRFSDNQPHNKAAGNGNTGKSPKPKRRR